MVSRWDQKICRDNFRGSRTSGRDISLSLEREDLHEPAQFSGCPGGSSDRRHFTQACSTEGASVFTADLTGLERWRLVVKRPNDPGLELTATLIKGFRLGKIISAAAADPRLAYQ